MAGATAESHGLSRIGAAEEVRALHFPHTSREPHKWHKQTKTHTHTLIEPLVAELQESRKPRSVLQGRWWW